MSTTIYFKSSRDDVQVVDMVKSAIDAEITRLELALELAEKRLLPFEKKYKVSSKYFISNMAAEDLEGGDDEYIDWAGEYQLKQRLEEKLQRLKEIEYADSDVLHTN